MPAVVANRTAASIWNGSITMMLSMMMDHNLRQNPALARSRASRLGGLSLMYRSSRAEMRPPAEAGANCKSWREGCGGLRKRVVVMLVAYFWTHNHMSIAPPASGWEVLRRSTVREH